MTGRISRRTILRGTGAALALPLLDLMRPVTALGERTAVAEAAPPQRFFFAYVPNGVVQDAWHPEQTGRDYELPRSLAPLAKFREETNVFTGLDRTFAGGTGVHAQAGACWLTSSPPDAARDGAFPTDVSLDQLLAARLGRETVLPSLELSCNDHTNNKETRYFESISWYGPGYAASVEKNPRNVFRRLFGGRRTGEGFRSVLDTVLEDARSLERRLGRDDRAKLDEYTDSVRSIERRIELAETRARGAGDPPIAEPSGIPNDRGEYVRLMGDLAVLAFQADLTRVATLVVDPERWDTPRMYHGVFDSPQNHHVLTHTKGDEAREALRKIDHFHVAQFARTVEFAGSVKEGERSLLESGLFVLGSGLGDGRVHSYKDLPVVTVGRCGGRLATGEHRAYANEKPLANLWLTLLETAGVQKREFADSTGTLPELVSSQDNG